MSKLYTIKEETLTGIADAIRSKNGGVELYRPTNMADAVNAIQTGSGMAFNIAYGDAVPEGIGKLWLKTEAPVGVVVNPDVVAEGTLMEPDIGTIPKAASNIAAAAIGTKIYLFGGRYSSRLNTIYEFDTVKKTLTNTGTTIKTPCGFIAAAAVGKEIYLFGGGFNSSYQQVIQLFDTETYSISTLSTKIAAPSYGIAAAAVGTKIYLFGGYGYRGGASTYLSMIQVFDTVTQRISTITTSLPVAAAYMSAVAMGTKIYLFGGYGITDGTTSYLNVIQIFDTVTGQLAAVDAIALTAAYGIAAAAIGTKIYLLGGQDSADTHVSAIQVYDTESNSISTPTTVLPTAATYIAGAASGTDIYLFGGQDNNSTYLNTINRFSLLVPLAANVLHIQTSMEKNRCLLVATDSATVETGVENVYIGNAEGFAEKVPAALYRNGAWVEL